MTYKFEDNKEEVVDDERPLATVSIGSDTEDDGTEGPEHEHQRNSPGYVCLGLAKIFGELLYCK